MISSEVFRDQAVLTELDTASASVNFRIGLGGPGVPGRGYGTEATALTGQWHDAISMAILCTDPRPGLSGG